MSVTFYGVSKRYGKKQVLADFSLRFPERGVVCLFGPSGSGKTTLLRMIAGLEKPDSGRIEGLPDRVAMNFQENRLLPWYTVRQNLALVTAQPDAWLAKVGLEDEGDRYPKELSGGMQRRVAFARALSYPADVLLLDEPFKELDDAARSRMIELARGQTARSLIVLVTHNLEEAAALGGEVYRFTGPPLNAISQPI